MKEQMEAARLEEERVIREKQARAREMLAGIQKANDFAKSMKE